MQAIIDFLGSEAGFNVIIGGIALVFGFVKKLEAIKNNRLEVCIDALQIGVQSTYEEYVRARKALNEDGELTDDERRMARTRAIDFAKEYAATKGVDLMKIYGPQLAQLAVEKLVKRSKTAGSLAEGVLDPFLD